MDSLHFPTVLQPLNLYHILHSSSQSLATATAQPGYKFRDLWSSGYDRQIQMYYTEVVHQ
ncbi:hypothetical protein Mapa_007035 [Marchantia paleacea]|nr:hypothetical protein Mapa_007035 [Marchantia paleacea]